MKQAYRILAFLIAIAVAVQSSLAVWSIAGLGIWIDDGGVLSSQTLEDSSGGNPPFSEFAGFMLHGMNGTIVIPLLAIIFLVVSFFAKVPGGVKFAAITFGLVALQIALGLFGHSMSILGALHGINALLLFSVAAMSGVRVRSAVAAPAVA
ncbi:MAG TPA: hypothetical protein PKX56_00150 [Marmoricola sp.]|nr:hypothetical protein [Marmoricola sp.]